MGVGKENGWVEERVALLGGEGGIVEIGRGTVG